MSAAPVYRLASYRMFEGSDDSARVAAEVLSSFTALVVIRHVAFGTVFWYAFDVDDWFIARIARKGTLADVLNLHALQGNVRFRIGLPLLRGALDPWQGMLDLSLPTRGSLFDLGDESTDVVRSLAPTAPEVDEVIYPDITSSKSHIDPGETIELTLSLAATPLAAIASPVDLHFPAGEPSVDLVAIVDSATLARPEGETWTTRFVVNRALSVSPTSWAFRVHARVPRPWYSLRVTFFARGEAVGRVDYTLRPRTAGEPLPATASGESIRLEARMVVPRTLKICRSERGGFELILLENGEIQGDRIPWTPTSTEYFQMLQNAKEYSELVQMGWSLHSDLSNEAARFLDWLEQREASLSPLLIESAEVFAPFELLQLRPGDNGPLLGVDRPVLRSIGKPTAHGPTLDVTRAACIRPSYQMQPLASAVDEEKEVRQRVGDTQTERIATSTDLDRMLDRDDIALVHFAGHADGNPAELWLEDRRVLPARFHPSRPLMKKARPFFFLNGCRAGIGTTEGPSVQTHMTAMLLRAGCTGVVAPLIRVDSPAAKEAALTFYNAVSNGDTIGEAVRRVRELAVTTAMPGWAATFLSYLAYGSIDLKLRWRAP